MWRSIIAHAKLLLLLHLHLHLHLLRTLLHLLLYLLLPAMLPMEALRLLLWRRRRRLWLRLLLLLLLLVGLAGPLPAATLATCLRLLLVIELDLMLCLFRTHPVLLDHNLHENRLLVPLQRLLMLLLHGLLLHLVGRLERVECGGSRWAGWAVPRRAIIAKDDVASLLLQPSFVRSILLVPNLRVRAEARRLLLPLVVARLRLLNPG